MSIQSELIESFRMFGTIAGNVLDKCVDLCNLYKVSAEELADQWGAFSASNLNGAPPTIDALDNMERKEFGRSYNQARKNLVTTPNTVKVYKSDLQDLDVDEMVMSSYSTPKSVKHGEKRTAREEGTSNRKKLQPGSLDFSPTTYTPSTKTQSTNYSERSDSGKTLLTYGARSASNWRRGAADDETSVEVGFPSAVMGNDARYMYEIMNAKAVSLNSVTEWLGGCLMKKNRLEQPTPFVKTSGVVTTYGRICCDSDGKLNAASVLLESTREFGKGSTIQLNLSKLANYALFPGQVIAAEGFSPNGSSFIAQKIYSDASLPQPSAIAATSPQGPLQIVVAAGPFTLKDNLAYEPLQDLIKHVTSNVPHVLVLIGPFVDATHDNIVDGAMAETFDGFFESLVAGIMTPLEGLNVQVVMVASQKDAHHHPVYPTPPYRLKRRYANLHLMADPSIIDVGGFKIGATSTDVLLHLGKEEICYSTQKVDRMSRLASYLLEQQSFYPLYPPDQEMSVDHELLEQFGAIEVVPDLLILPSNLRYFVKEINGCVVVNPERLAKGYVAGTFCRCELPARNAKNKNVAAEIIRI